MPEAAYNMDDLHRTILTYNGFKKDGPVKNLIALASAEYCGSTLLMIRGMVAPLPPW